MATPTRKKTKGESREPNASLEKALHDAAEKHGPGHARVNTIELEIGNPHIKVYRVEIEG
jgi:hypothetical protein